MADYFAATFARANAASAAVTALEEAGIQRYRMSYITPALLRPGEQEGMLQGLRRIFHPDVGLTGALIHMGFPEEAARMFTEAVEEGATLVVVIPGDQGRIVERTIQQHGAQRIVMLDAAGFDEVFIDRHGGPLKPQMPIPQEDTHNPEAAEALNTIEGMAMGETTDHLRDHG